MKAIGERMLWICSLVYTLTPAHPYTLTLTSSHPHTHIRTPLHHILTLTLTLSHPHSLTQSDFLLVMLKDMVQAYPELRVVLMSATIDTSLFAAYFDHAPVIEVMGKTFPVQGALLSYSIGNFFEGILVLRASAYLQILYFVEQLCVTPQLYCGAFVVFLNFPRWYQNLWNLWNLYPSKKDPGVWYWAIAWCTCVISWP